MKITRFNVAKPKKYEDKNGEEKTAWNSVGVLTVFEKDDGKVNRLLEIPAIGLEAHLFPIEDKKDKPQAEETPDSPF